MRIVIGLPIALLVAALCLAAAPAPQAQVPSTQGLPPKLTEASSACLECHAEQMPGLVMEWRQSRHFAAKVGCFECHAAQAADPDALDHNGHTISVIVSPKDCAKCHPVPAEEFAGSHHADAGAILGSLDNMLGEVVEGPAAAATGCKQCHGAVIKVNADKTLDPLTWPNSGIGRINPDGSKGSCAACHSRHSFDAALARQPENCGKCHLGPDHPQMEIYEESKHGIAYYANIPRMNLHSLWIAQYLNDVSQIPNNQVQYRFFHEFLRDSSGTLPPSVVKKPIEDSVIRWQFSEKGDGYFYVYNPITEHPKYTTGKKSADLNISIQGREEFLKSYLVKFQ